MSILSNQDIEEICEYLSIPLIGVFSKDRLPKKRKDGAYIVNMADSTSPTGGTHWFCFIITNNTKTCWYFDSFATPPPLQVMKFCKSCTNKTFNGVQVQGDTSTSCGWFAIAFCYYFYNAKHKDPIHEFVSKFYQGTYLQRNDKLLKEFFKNLIR